MDRFSSGNRLFSPANRMDDFEAPRQTQRNSMFFTEEDDDDESIFGDTNDTPTNLMASCNRSVTSVNDVVRNLQCQDNRKVNAGTNARRIINSPTRRPVERSFRQQSQNKPGAKRHFPPSTASSTPETILIKDEDDMDTTAQLDFLRTVPQDQRVKIYVGRKNRAFYVRKTDLSKSSILHSYVVDDPVQGAFIMRPQLITTHFNHFEAVAQFLRSGEYDPMLLENTTDPEGPKILGGLAKDVDYAKELVKSGKVYSLAKNLKVQGLPELVFRKVSEVDGSRYSLQSLIEVAEAVFNDRNEAVKLGFKVADVSAVVSAGNGGGHGAEDQDDGENSNENDAGGLSSVDNLQANIRSGGEIEKDALEEWIVDRLAHNFQEISRIQHDTFWEAVGKTGRSMMLSRVLERVAEQYRAAGGRLPAPVVELD